MKVGDIIYLSISLILASTIIGISVYYFCEGDTIVGLLGIALGITDAFDAWHHVSKWNKMDNKIKRIRKN